MKEETFYPRHFFRVISISLLVIAILVVLATVAPFGLNKKANPLETPPGIKPEWYLLAPYQFLKYLPKEIGVVIILLFCVFMVIFPLLIKKSTKLVIFAGWVILIAFILLTLLGGISNGR